MAWNKRIFTTVGVTAWIVPAGVKEIILFGYGGGGGGGGGSSSYAFGVDEAPQGGGGGAGSRPTWSRRAVTPGNSYDIYIGDGGDGGLGAASPNNDGNPGANGGDTYFDNSGTPVAFYGGGLGLGGIHNTDRTQQVYVCGGRSFFEGLILEVSDLRKPNEPGDGGCGATGFDTPQTQWSNGRPCLGGAGSGGTKGTKGASFGGGPPPQCWGGGPGGGGGGGYDGNGGNGGNGSDGSGGAVTHAGYPGSSASSNSGAGGGGGGASGQGYPALAGGDGGKGGSGALIIYWWS